MYVLRTCWLKGLIVSPISSNPWLRLAAWPNARLPDGQLRAAEADDSCFLSTWMIPDTIYTYIYIYILHSTRHAHCLISSRQVACPVSALPFYPPAALKRLKCYSVSQVACGSAAHAQLSRLTAHESNFWSNLNSPVGFPPPSVE